MNMKKLTIYASLLFFTIMLSACGTAVAAQSNESVQRTLSVNGTGKAYLSPDIARIMIGVHTEGTDAAEAVASNNSKTQQVKEILLDYKINPEEIQTAYFSIWPNQQYDRDGKLQGIIYMVDNTLSVTLRDLDQIGIVLDAVIEAGANRIDSIQFDVEDKSDALTKARKAAVADAETQARELAEAAELTLGQIQSISSFGSGVPIAMYEGMGGGGMGAAQASVPVSPGQLVLTVDVNAVYQIE
jgi:uncharacterized protein YggE